ISRYTEIAPHTLSTVTSPRSNTRDNTTTMPIASSARIETVLATSMVVETISMAGSADSAFWSSTMRDKTGTAIRKYRLRVALSTISIAMVKNTISTAIAITGWLPNNTAEIGYRAITTRR